MEPQSFGPSCALHQNQPANQTCSRCGNFMCAQCGPPSEHPTCPRCVELSGGTAFPFRRDDYDFGRVWSFAMEHWKREWVMLSLAALILFIAGAVGGIANNVAQAAAGGGRAGQPDVAKIVVAAVIGTLVAQVINMVVQGLVLLGVIRLTIDVVMGKKADLNRLFSQVSKLPRYIIQSILIFVMVGLPQLLYLGGLVAAAALVSGASFSDGFENFMESLVSGPGVAVLALGMLVWIAAVIYIALPLRLAPYELVLGDCTPLEAIKRAWKMGDGHRLPLFGYGFVGGLVMMVGMLACCIGILPAYGLYLALELTLFLALRNGMGFPTPPEA